MRRRTLGKIGLLLGGFAVAIGGATLYASTAASQQPPPLASEEMLRLVLPLDESGRRPAVLAWARIDGVSTRDGAPEIFVALLYETAAPFDQTDLRRLVNRVRWDGERYEAARQDEPGEVLEDELRWLMLPRWSVAIESRAISVRRTRSTR